VAGVAAGVPRPARLDVGGPGIGAAVLRYVPDGWAPLRQLLDQAAAGERIPLQWAWSAVEILVASGRVEVWSGGDDGPTVTYVRRR